MDENSDLRLVIETARKNKNWARRCYAYEMAMEYFSLLESDSYELCSYCDSIPEFLQEKDEFCLMSALTAVKVFVNRCVEAPSIARPVTRAIIEDLFFSGSAKVREAATEVILDFIEWEACDAVLKELMSGALRYDGVRSDECVRVMRYALLDFGPHVISIYRLFDFIEELVRNKSILSINDECSQLLIAIYRCLGPQVRVHLSQILDPNYISAIEDSYEETRNIPIYHCRFVRYSKDNSSPFRETDEEMFAACRIVDRTSQPSASYFENEDMFIEGEDGDDRVFEIVPSRLRDFGREPYYRGGDVVPRANDNKQYWRPQRYDDMANYEVDYGAGLSNQHRGNHDRLCDDHNEGTYEVLDNFDRADSVPESFRHVPDVSFEPENLEHRWNRSNLEEIPVYSRPVSAEDKACQTNGYSLRYVNPFEAIIKKLMDNCGTETILECLWRKFNSIQERKVRGKGTKESRVFHLSRNCKSLESLAASKEQIRHKSRSSLSRTTVRRCFSNSLSTYSDWNGPNGCLIYPKNVINVKRKDRMVRKKTFSSVKNQPTRMLQVFEKQTENLTTVPVMSFEGVDLSQEYPQNSIKEGKKENISVLVKNKSHKGSNIIRFVCNVFEKMIFLFSKKKETGIDDLEDPKYFAKKFHCVLKRKRPQNNTDQKIFYPYLNNNQKIYYFHQDTRMFLQSEMENSCSIDKHSNSYRNTSTSRNTNFLSVPSDFSDSSQIYLSQNQIPSESFFINGDGNEDLCSFPSLAKENKDEEIICLSESESVSEISPNLQKSFQKNSMRRMASRNHVCNTKDEHKTCEKDKNKAEEGHPGSEFGRRNRKSSFRLTSEGNPVGAISLRHRGCGDELPQTASKTQKNEEASAQEEERSCGRRGQKLFCCISMNDGNE